MLLKIQRSCPFSLNNNSTAILGNLGYRLFPWAALFHLAYFVRTIFRSIFPLNGQQSAVIYPDKFVLFVLMCVRGYF